MIDNPDKFRALIDDESLGWIADVPDNAHGYVQQLRMEALAFDNPIKQEIVDMIMRTSGTRSGRHADRLLEAVKDRPEKEVDQDAMFQLAADDVEPSVDGEESAEKGLALRD